MTEDQQLELVEQLAEEFTARSRRGERPTIKQYVERYPELADIIRDTFQALVMMEDLAPASDDSFGDASPISKPALGAARLDYLGDYRIIREVGRGGMGIVYEAEQVSLGRHVAVKVLPTELLQNPKHRARFEREAKAAAKLHHTNIVPVFGVGEENGVGYYVMQFIRGLALDEVLEELKRMKLTPGSSGATVEISRAGARHREVSAADVARSLMEGDFKGLADDSEDGPPGPSPDNVTDGESRRAGAPVKQQPLDETMDHGPDADRPAYPPTGAAGEDPNVAFRSAKGRPFAERKATLGDKVGQPSDSSTAARQSDTVFLPSASDAISGGSSGAHKRDRKFTYWQSVAQIGVQVAEALHYAHAQGVLHRDIKPSNLLLDLRGTVWITDFGLAKLDDDRGLTQTGDILGTLRYLAPEALRQEADARSEVYSLGLTLYELLALRPAIEPTHRHAILDQVISGQIEPLPKRNPDVPRDLTTIVHKAIEREPRHRYQTAQELADDLRRFIDDEPIQARQLSTVEHVLRWSRHNRGLAASLAAVAGLVCLLAIGSTIMAGYFRSVSGKLSNTVQSLKATQVELHANVEALNQATGEAQAKATENLQLANVAQQNLRKAEAAEEESRRLLYNTDMRLAPFVWKDGGSTAEQLRALLARHEPQSIGNSLRDVPRVAGAEAGRNVRSHSRDVSPASDAPVPAIPGHRRGNASAVKEALSRGSAPATAGQDISTGDKDDLRGFEWRYYKHLLENSAAVFRGHDAPVIDAALAADGQLVTLDDNWQIRHWAVETRAEDSAGRVKLGEGRSVQAGALAPDGRLAALAVDEEVRLLDTATGEQLFRFDSANSRLRKLAFSDDGGLLVILDDKLRWCDTTDGTVVAALDKSADRLAALALSADGHTLALAGHGPLGILTSVFRLDAAKHITEAAKEANANITIGAVAASADGSLVATSLKFRGGLSIFDASTGKLLGSKSLAHASPISALAFSADGSKLATADAQGTIHIWGDVRLPDATSVATRTLKGHSGAVTSLHFSADGRRLVSASSDKTARIWTVDEPAGALTALRGSAYCWDARFSPDGLLIAAAGGKRVRLWDAATGQPVGELSGDGSQVASVAFSPDKRMLAVGHGGTKTVSYVSLWDIDSGRMLARMPGLTDLADVPQQNDFRSASAVAFSPDGKYLAAAFGPRSVFSSQRFSCPLKVWGVATRRPIRRPVGHLGACTSLDFSPQGGLLASGSQDGTAILWSTQTWKAVRTLENPDSGSSEHGRIVADVAFSPDGHTLAMASRGGSVVLWDVATGVPMATLKGHSSSVTAVAFCPDGRTLASCGDDQTVRLWNVNTRRELIELDSSTAELGRAQSLAFSPDGSRLLVSGEHPRFWSAAASIWDEPGRAAKALERVLDSGVDFRRRIRRWSENLRLHEALALMDSDDARVRAALAATRANWHAAHQRWPAAVEEFDRLKQSGAGGPEDWLRTPGLVRVARALAERGRFADAATALSGIVGRRIADAAGNETDDLLATFLAAIDQRLAADPQNVALLELRAALAAQQADGAPEAIADPWVRMAVAYRTDGNQPAIEELLERRPEAAGPIGDLFASDNDWQRAVDIYSKGIGSPGAPGFPDRPNSLSDTGRPGKAILHDAELLAKRAAAYERLQEWDAAAADWAQTAQTSPDAAELLAEFARRLAQNGQSALAASHFERAQRHYEDDLRADPGNDVAAEALANLLLDARRLDEKWNVLKPVEMKSKLGTTFTLQMDGSLLTGAQKQRCDSYTITYACGSQRIAALRLEALPHPSLRGSGPGCGEHGKFRLTDVRASLRRPEKSDVPLSFQGRIADHASQATVGDNGQTSWNLWPGDQRVHSLILVPRAAVDLAADDQIIVDLSFSDPKWPWARLGCFRLSVTDSADDAPIARLDAGNIRNPWMRLAAAYTWQGQVDKATPLAERALEDAKSVAEKAQILDDAASQENLLAAVAKRHPDDPQLQLAWAKCLADRGRRLLGPALQADRLADAERDLMAAQALVARLRAEYPPPTWTVLKPSKTTSQGGATLTVLDDRSVLASGPDPATDVYEIEAQLDAGSFTAVRLEGLPHPSLPAGEASRGEHGNVLLSEFELEIVSPAESDTWQSVRIERTWADRDVTGFAIDRAIDAQQATGWGSMGTAGKSTRAAVFISQRPFGTPGGTRLRIRLRHENQQWAHRQFGRFRLSATAAPHVLEATAVDQVNRQLRDALVALNKVHPPGHR